MEKGFYVVSLKHTNKTDRFITLWKPDDCGYCFSKENAGVYETPKKGYHDSGDDSMPIPVSLGDGLFIKAIYDGSERLMIPNCAAVWDALNVRYKGRDLIRKKS